MIGVVQHIVVMGVSGAGKSTTGEALARRLGWPYTEGDAFHPPANVEKMHAGIPLTDADRAPWLRALAAELAGIVACLTYALPMRLNIVVAIVVAVAVCMLLEPKKKQAVSGSHRV